jgi:hypothetical protein
MKRHSETAMVNSKVATVSLSCHVDKSEIHHSARNWQGLVETACACWLGDTTVCLVNAILQNRLTILELQNELVSFLMFQTVFFHLLYFSHSDGQKWRKLDRVILYNDLSTNVCTTAKIPHTTASTTKHKLLRWCQ